MALLDIKDLDVHYGGIHALKGVTMKVEAGEVVTLIGANGAGKTTTLRAISGLVKPSGGTVHFKNELIASGGKTDQPLWQQLIAGADQIGPHTIVSRGLVHAPEGRGIFSNMTVLENLEIGAFLRKDSAEIKKDMAHALSLFPR